jgi:RHS repeat-associated protein
MKAIKLLSTLILCFVGSLTYAQNQTILVQPTGDAYISSATPENNYGGNSSLFIQTHAPEESEPFSDRTLLKFDLESIGIPFNAVIVSASLKLNGISHVTGNENTNQSLLEFIKEPWDEMGVNWENQPMVTQENQVELLSTTSSDQDLNIDLTSWYRKNHIGANESGNYGFMIRLEEEQPEAKLSFSSKEGVEQISPELEIVYRIPSQLIFSLRPTEMDKDLPNGGSIAVKVTQGDGPFQFQWSSNVGSNQLTKSEVTGLAAGTYTVTVTDDNQVSDIKAIGLGYDPMWEADNSNLFTYFSNVLTRTRSNNNWYGTTVSQATLNSSNGWFEYTVQQYSGRKIFGFSKADGLSPNTWTGIEYGLYLDNSGALRLVTSGALAYLGNFTVGDILRISKSGANFSISKNGTVLTAGNRNISSLNTEVYVKTTSFDTGTRLEGVRTSFSNFLTIDFDLTPLKTAGAANGVLTVNPTSGISPYTYMWSNGATTKEITGLSDATYYVTVMDASGLTKVANKRVKSVDDAWNWEEEKVYDNDGNLLGATKTYFNAFQKPVQTQSKMMDEKNVMVSQTIYDTYGRAAISTLPAPNFEKEFEYQDNFIKAVGNSAYDISKFDLPNTTSNLNGEIDNPTSVASDEKGTLGWFYSHNNNVEPYVATTSFPYTRPEYSNLNPGQVRKMSAPHDELKMGSGKEVESYRMPVAGELVYFFGFAEGWEIANFSGVGDPGSGEGDVLNIGSEYTTFFGYPPDFPFLKKVWKSIAIDQDGKQSVQFTDLDGKTIATCQVDASGSSIFPVASLIESTAPGSYVDIHITENPVAGSDNLFIEKWTLPTRYFFTIYDLSTDEVVMTISDRNIKSVSLQPGFYRVMDNRGKNITTLKYNLNYNAVSLNYFDKRNNLIATVSPEGFDDSFDISGLSSTESHQSEMFDYDATLTDNWKFLNPTNPSVHNKIQHNLSPNPNPEDDLQFTNVFVYLAEKTDPQALVSNDISNGQVDMLPTDPGYPEGGANGAEGGVPSAPMHMSSNGNGIVSISSDRIAGGGGTDHGPGGPGGPGDPNNDCGLRPGDKRRYEFKVDIKAILNDGSAPVILKGNQHMTAYRSFVGMSHTVTEWSFYSWGQGNTNSHVEDGFLTRNVPGVVAVSVSNTLSKKIQSVEIEIKELTRVDNIFDAVLRGQSYCYYDYLDPDVVDPDLSEIQNDLELRVKSITYNLRSDNFVPAHDIAEMIYYNTASQVVRKSSVDEGTTEFIYTEKGLLRFSQNQEQRNASPKRFSYVNYDHLDRIIESGEALEGNSANLRFPTTGIIHPSDVYVDDHVILNVNKSSLPITKVEKVEPSHSIYESVVPISVYDPALDASAAYSQNESRLWGQLSYSMNDNNVTVFNYDIFGRVDWTVQKITGLGTKTKDIVYNDRGEIEKVIYQKENLDEYFEHRYSYDKSGRLKKAYARMSPTAAYSKEAEYFYYIHGPLKRVELAENLQGIDYTYNTLGYLKAINSPNLGNTAINKFGDPGDDGLLSNGFEEDVFGMSLDYFSRDYVRPGTFINYSNYHDNNYNGNIKSARWNTKNQIASGGGQWLYRYLYNEKNWITEANFGTYQPVCQNHEFGGVCTTTPSLGFNSNQAYKVNDITYDKLGNIQRLRRRGTNGTMMDDFTYHYSTNKVSKLLNLSDAVGNTVFTEDLDERLTGTGDDFVYDDMGRMIEDKIQGHELVYNGLGLVKQVNKKYGNTYVPIVTYFYDEGGVRIAKTSFNQSGTAIRKQWYVGGVKYDQDLTAPATYIPIEYDLIGSSRIGKFNRTSRTEGSKTYEITDHLGNVRATVGKDVGGLALLSYADYYPFGSEMPGRKFVGAGEEYNHKYQGQFTEYDEEVNWDAFQLRNWDGRLARWTSIDPASQYWSPYLGMGNNPINMVDPDGAYSKFGAWLRNGFSKNGLSQNNAGEWGFEVTGGEVSGSGSWNSDGTYHLAEVTGASWDFGTPKSLPSSNPVVNGVYGSQRAFLSHPVTQYTALALATVMTAGIAASYSATVSSYQVARTVNTARKTIEKLNDFTNNYDMIDYSKPQPRSPNGQFQSHPRISFGRGSDAGNLNTLNPGSSAARPTPFYNPNVPNWLKWTTGAGGAGAITYDRYQKHISK